MKKISILSLIFFLIGLPTFAQNEPVVMTINGKPIPKSDFEYIYHKNNSSNVLDKKTLEEYVEMFIDFKLKVEEAIAQGIDTTQAFKSEFTSYRDQLSSQYLNVGKIDKELLEDTYERMRTEVQVSQIVLQIPNTGTAADTLKIYNKAMDIYNRAQNEDFGKLAAEVSDDPSAKTNKGYIGWITALRTPYEFEITAYNTPVGQVSKPIRTFIGYHIIKVSARRPSPGQVKVAHILLLDDKANPLVKDNNKVRIDSIYQRLKAGDDFGEMASKFSQDPGSASQKGELPWFGTGQTLPEFEEQAFALTDSGSISKPIHSLAGWHIIKLIDKKPLGAFENMKSEIENQIVRTRRDSHIGDSFINKLKEEYNFTENAQTLKKYFQLVDRVAPNDSAFPREVNRLGDEVLFTISGHNFYQKDFNSYLLANSQPYRGVRSDFLSYTYDRYVKQEIINFEKSRLAVKYPEYKHLVNEYYDGILLFEIMNKEVWEKASKDTEGLKMYFENNIDKYKWDNKHYKGYIIYAKDKETLEAAKRIVKYADFDSIAHYIPERLNDSIQYTKVTKGLWEKGENKIIDYKVFRGKKYKPTKDFPYYFVLGKKLIKPEVYTDVKGKIIADYQDYLEKEWIRALRKKYPVVMNEDVLQSVDKN